jgi:formylglycine-generating enzyme required for sulfatase activity
VLTLLLLAAAPAASNAVIWTGAQTEEAAKEKLSEWAKDERTWSERLRLGAGYPKLVKSDSLPGLKPGFHVILLGICNAEQVRPRTRALKELYPYTYWRPLTEKQPEACPELLCTSGGDMVAVPGGTFQEGCAANRGLDCGTQPTVHPKELAGFEVDRTPVTRSAYAACVAHKECSALDEPKSDRLPALGSYKQAWAYCASQGKRVVRDDEWEKAARGTDTRRFPWGQRMPDCGMAHWKTCALELKPVASFPAWSSPYGALDLMGPGEWTDGTPKDLDGKKCFPVRGILVEPANFALWQQHCRFGEERLAFRCARACTWREGRPLPKLPDPVDAPVKVDPAYEAVADPSVREALEKWRKARAAELGEGATVEWRGKTELAWERARNTVRETAGGVCREGPVQLKLETVHGERVASMDQGAAAACCKTDLKCVETPRGAAQRFLEAYAKSDVDAVEPFIPSKGFTYELQYNDDPPKRTKIKRDGVYDMERLEDADPLWLECDADFDAKGAAKCHGAADIALLKTKSGIVVIHVEMYITEGC